MPTPPRKPDPLIIYTREENDEACMVQLVADSPQRWLGRQGSRGETIYSFHGVVFFKAKGEWTAQLCVLTQAQARELDPSPRYDLRDFDDVYACLSYLRTRYP